MGSHAEAPRQGCTVEVLHGELSSRPVRALGSVRARCRGAAASDDAWCLQELQNQACAMGGNVLWAISSQDTDEGREMHGSVGVFR